MVGWIHWVSKYIYIHGLIGIPTGLVIKVLYMYRLIGQQACIYIYICELSSVYLMVYPILGILYRCIPNLLLGMYIYIYVYLMYYIC